MNGGLDRIERGVGLGLVVWLAFLMAFLTIVLHTPLSSPTTTPTQVKSYGIFNPRPYQLKAFIPFFDQYRNSLSPWSPDSQAFCYCQREGAYIQRLKKAAVPEELKKEMDRIRRGKAGVIFLPDIDDESSAYKLGDDLEVLTWSWN